MRRRVAVPLLAVVAAGLLTACDASGAPAGPTTTATRAADDVVRIRFDHREREPLRIPTVVVPRGATIEMVVGSDVAHRILVPELGRTLDVSAGGTVTIRFLALGTLSVRIGDTPDAVRGGTVIARVVPKIL
ncbi:hypothetical protein [Pseudonocardia phyllosphaerae]|uniref:hypothetical protein n=1 Tax=Pseudonocardia phyllosphaerae TaxID=3390502 RepID=UPI00397B533E